MDKLGIVSHFVHLAAVIVAVGGATFMWIVLAPAAGSALDSDTHERLREAVRNRWRLLVHGCIALLLLSGLFNAYISISQGRSTAYLILFVIKFLAALAVFFLASALVGRSAAFESLRRAPRRWLGLVVTLSAVIVILAVAMHALSAAAGAGSAN